MMRDIKPPNSTDIIGDPHKRFDECYCFKQDDWRSYYHGWIEGRAALYAELGVWQEASRKDILSWEAKYCEVGVKK